MRGWLAVALTGFTLLLPAELCADEKAVPRELLVKLAMSSARFEAMMEKVSFTVTGRMGSVSDDGSLSAVKEGVFSVKIHGGTTKVDIVKYIDDGQDKTAEAKKKAAERAKEPKKARGDQVEIHIPFLESEQPRYDFHVGETDPRDPTHTRIFFHAKTPAENAMNGSAWVDTRTGNVLTTSITASKTPAFVSYLRAQLEFTESTPKGPAISKLSFEGAGGILFFRKHFRGTATLSSYELTP